MLRHFRAVIIGAPGSGKGTISSRIVRKFDTQHISSGDLLRQHVLRGTAVGREARTYMDQGKLVPERLMISLIIDVLRSNNAQSWLLDGFPRTRSQAEILREELPVDAAINLLVPFDVIIERISKRWIHLPSGRVYNTDFKPPKRAGIDDLTGEPLIQREDDKQEAVQERLQVYSKMIGPVLDFYREEGILEEFAGTTSDEIWPLVYKFLSSHISPICQDVKL